MAVFVTWCGVAQAAAALIVGVFCAIAWLRAPEPTREEVERGELMRSSSWPGKE